MSRDKEILKRKAELTTADGAKKHGSIMEFVRGKGIKFLNAVNEIEFIPKTDIQDIFIFFGK